MAAGGRSGGGIGGKSMKKCGWAANAPRADGGRRRPAGGRPAAAAGRRSGRAAAGGQNHEKLENHDKREI